jgi:hypothetical protein
VWIIVYVLFLVATGPKWLPWALDLLWTFRWAGDPITVVVGRTCVTARIVARCDEMLEWEPEGLASDVMVQELMRVNASYLLRPMRVQFYDEGIAWARGWDTPDAKALAAAQALT